MLPLISFRILTQKRPGRIGTKTRNCLRELHSLTVSKSVRFLYSEGAAGFRRCSWDVKLSKECSENIQLPEDESSGSCILPGLPSKYFRPHLVNRRRFQPPCCFNAGKSDARRSCLQADTGVIRLQPYLRQTSLNFPKWVCLIKLLATIIMEILRISETDDL